MWNSWGTTHEFLVFLYLKVRSLEQENVSVVYLFWLKIHTELKKMGLIWSDIIGSRYFPVLWWHIFRLSEPEALQWLAGKGEPVVWGLRGEGVVFQGWIGDMDSVRTHSYSSLPPWRGVFPATHSCCCCCAALVLLTRAGTPFLRGFACCFYQCHWWVNLGAWQVLRAAPARRKSVQLRAGLGWAQPPHSYADEWL